MTTLARLLGYGPAMMEPRALRTLADACAQIERARMTIGASPVRHASGDSLADYLPQRTEHAYHVDAQGRAVIAIEGPIYAQTDPIADYLGEDYTVTQHLIAAIAEAAGRDDVGEIILAIDSPGGSVQLLEEARQAILAASAAKPVRAAVSGLCGSAAYYLATAAQEIVASPAAMIGSIGTMMVLHDYSAMAEAIGLRVIVVSTGPHKGAGTPGTAITDEHLQPFVALAESLGQQFQSAVAAGRGLDADAVAQLATGEIWIAAQAQQHGLIDRIETDPLGLLAHTGQAATDAGRSGATTPPAASGTAPTPTPEDLMDQKILSLIQAHPSHAVAIAEQAAAGASVESIEAHITTAAHASALAERDARITDLEAQLAAAQSTVAERDESLAQATAALAERDERLAKLGALGTSPKDPGTGEGSSLTAEQFQALSPSARADYLRSGGKLSAIVG